MLTAKNDGGVPALIVNCDLEKGGAFNSVINSVCGSAILASSEQVLVHVFMQAEYRGFVYNSPTWAIDSDESL
jgi:hypothetical protein